MSALCGFLFQIKPVFYIIGISPLAVAGDQFSYESGEEELGADDDRGKRKIEKRLFRDGAVIYSMYLVADLFNYHPYHHDASNDEQQ